MCMCVCVCVRACVCVRVCVCVWRHGLMATRGVQDEYAENAEERTLVARLGMVGERIAGMWAEAGAGAAAAGAAAASTLGAPVSYTRLCLKLRVCCMRMLRFVYSD